MTNERLHPWLHIWTRPRQVIRGVLSGEQSRRNIIILAGVSGILRALDQATSRSLGDQMNMMMVLLVSLISGFIGGFISLYLISWIMKFTGKWIGGQASFHEVLTATAWSNVILIWVGILWIPKLLLFGYELFTTATPIMDANPTLKLLLVIFGVIEVVLSIWAVVVYILILSEVQKFSGWMALLNVILALVIAFLIIMAITIVISLILSVFAFGIGIGG
ncbi:Yip1 family protein [Paenibacillus guangzhouensis]|uniref:Yip1 family protein n=1 Tax=Paenibacillus guangzhouensis TaxID=1473112 RepID=UPI0012668959|nr:Yip1 family protein [Paenibacillus guangzhouensis]